MSQELYDIIVLGLRVYSRLAGLALIAGVWFNWTLLTSRVTRARTRPKIYVFSLLFVAGILMSFLDYFTSSVWLYLLTITFNSTSIALLAWYLTKHAYKIKRLAGPGKLEALAEAFDDLLESLKTK